MRRISLAVAALAAVAAAHGAMAQTLRIGINDDPDGLDPTLSRIYSGRIVLTALCDRLFEVTPDLKIVPQLATSYEWGPGQRSLTLKLRQGVTFHNGEKFDAEAVKFTLQRGITMPASFRKSEIGQISGYEIIDDHTIRIDLSTAYVPLLAQLTDRAGMMLAPKSTEAAGDKFANHPICAGPFKFVERLPQDHITVERFDKYWNADKVALQRVVFTPVLDTTVRVASLQAGSLDFIERVSPTDLNKIKGDPALVLASANEIGFQFMSVNLDNGPRSKTPIGQDPRIREAFELAIDRDVVTQVVFNGAYIPGNQFVPPDSIYYNKDRPVPHRDLARAKALLREAGKPNPVIHLIVPNNPDFVQAAQVMQSMVQEAGIDLRLQVMENASALAASRKGDFEMLLTFWSGRTDPSGNSYSFLVCKGAQNDPHYCNQEVDDLLNRAVASADQAETVKLYNQIEAIALRDRPYYYLWHRKWFWGYTKKLDGFVPYPDGLIRLVGVRLNP